MQSPVTPHFLLDADGRVARSVLCARCEADLALSRAAGRCPTCGHGVEASLSEHLTQSALDASGTVVEERRCGRCDYDLRGLPFDGRCPECAAAVRDAVYSGSRRHAERDWLVNVRGGSEMLMVLLMFLAIPGVLLMMVDVYVGAFAFLVWNALVAPFAVHTLCAPPPREEGWSRTVRAYGRAVFPWWLLLAIPLGCGGCLSENSWIGGAAAVVSLLALPTAWLALAVTILDFMGRVCVLNGTHCPVYFRAPIVLWLGAAVLAAVTFPITSLTRVSDGLHGLLMIMLILFFAALAFALHGLARAVDQALLRGYQFDSCPIGAAPGARLPGAP